MSDSTIHLFPTDYNEEIAMVNYFVDLLENRLAGRHETRIVNREPVDHCYLGVLGPWRQEVDEPDILPPEPDDLKNQDASALSSTHSIQPTVTSMEAQSIATDNDSSSPPDSEVDREYHRRPPSSIGFEVLVIPEDKSVVLTVAARFTIYTRHLPTYNEQLTSLGGSGDLPIQGPMSLAEVCERREIVVPSISFNIPYDRSITLHDNGQVQRILDQTLDIAVACSDALPSFDSMPKVNAEALKDSRSYQLFLEERKKGVEIKRSIIKARLEVRTEPLPGKVRVSVYLRNNTPRADGVEVKHSEDHYNIIADARLTAEVVKGSLLPVEFLPVPEDYQYERKVWVVGHNTSAIINRDKRHIATNALARYDQLRTTTQTEPAAKFNQLAQTPISTLENIYNAMSSFANHWQHDVIDDNMLDLDSAALVECQKDLDNFFAEIDHFACGIASLNKDRNLLKAFEGMNRVMARLASGYDQWRLFQIAFIVTQLPALALRSGHTAGEWPNGMRRHWEDHLDVADVLWFTTGGGKTEAYLGLVSCAMLYDRLRGKALGVTAWLRFPLRMLSMQQLQRAIRMVWETEKERRHLLGERANETDPIRLGYLVGNPPTPNILSVDSMDKYKEASLLEPLRVIADCPACNGKDTIYVHPDPVALRFKHLCRNCKEELPLLVSDSEVYRFLPALIVGTIDKMATIGLQQLFGILWAGPHWRCPVHGYGMGDYCVFGCKKKPSERQKIYLTDPGPALHVQDELHLLQEELGAFAGHYETLIRYCEEKTSSLPAKVVAATATIEGFEHQVRHLYGVKGARRFPGRGYDRYTTFYTARDCDPKNQNSQKVQRAFIAFRPSSGNSSDVAAKCTQILHEAISGMLKNPDHALAELPAISSPRVLCNLLHYYSATLTYVGNLQSGTRVKEHLLELSPQIYDGLRELNVEYLSSRSSSGEVSQVIHRMENPPELGSKNFLDAVVATNMISHGVDLERINLMVMDRFPSGVAEYIQASSRSGRKKVGLVTLVLPSYSQRAASLYNRFKEFHEHLDLMVSPVPVNRFAKYAVSRTIPGILTGLLFGLFGPTSKHSKKLVAKRRDAALALIKDDIPRFLQSIKYAYGLERGVYDLELEQAMALAIRDRFDELLILLNGSHEDSVTEALRPKPMRSLRDVDTGVPFYPTYGDPSYLMWFRKD